jgi:hypothetical protein
VKIIEKVQLKKAQLKAEVEMSKRNGSEPVQTLANRDKAVAAIQAGIRSKAWKTYMEQFADTPEQLMRLTGTDGTLENATLSIRRAYLVGNAVCGSGTPTNLDQEVDTIDNEPEP